MPVNLNHRQISALAKLDTAGVPHAKRLEMFAGTLGYASTSAMMAAARESAPLVPGAQPAGKTEAKASRIDVSKLLPEVTANMYSDNGVVDITVDVREWLLSLNSEKVRKLAEEMFGNGIVSDTALDFYATKDDDAKNLLRYLSSAHSEGGLLGEAGYTVHVEEEEAVEFLARHHAGAREEMAKLANKGLIEIEDEWIEHWDDLRKSHTVLIDVEATSPLEDFEEEDLEDGDDAISGKRVITVVSDDIISREYACERALDHFHEKIGIAGPDCFEITAKTISAGVVPEDADNWGEIEEDAPGMHGAEYPEI